MQVFLRASARSFLKIKAQKFQSGAMHDEIWLTFKICTLLMCLGIFGFIITTESLCILSSKNLTKSSASLLSSCLSFFRLCARMFSYKTAAFSRSSRSRPSISWLSSVTKDWGNQLTLAGVSLMSGVFILSKISGSFVHVVAALVVLALLWAHYSLDDE